MLWFKNKRYGFGWHPVSWQGWLSLFVLIVVQVLNFLRLDANSESSSDTLRPFIIETFIFSYIFYLIIGDKGEKMRWQWGDKK